jgi:hypothetical protein
MKTITKILAEHAATDRYNPILFSGGPIDLPDISDPFNQCLQEDKFKTYMWLRERIVQTNGLKHYSDGIIKRGFYDMLGTSISILELAAALNISEFLAREHIQQLKQDMLLLTYTITADQSDEGREYTLYFLGVYGEDGDHWFIDEVFPGRYHHA